MLHGIKQLVLVNKVAYQEVRQTCQQDLPRIPQHTVYHTDDEDEDSLWQKKAVAEDRRLDKLCVV